MELEIRAKIENIKTLEESLNSLEGVEIINNGTRQTDSYLRHPGDKDKRSVFRIRRTEKGSIFSVKTRTDGVEDIMWNDIDIPIEEPDKLEDILINGGYQYAVIVDKVRATYKYMDFEINVDNVRDLGVFVEIEKLISNASEKDKELENMIELLQTLGIDKTEIVKRGYVQLVEEKALNS